MIIGFLPHLLGTVAMTNWFLMLRKILSTILHHTFIQQSLNVSQVLPKILHDFARDFLSFQTFLWV